MVLPDYVEILRSDELTDDERKDILLVQFYNCLLDEDNEHHEQNNESFEQDAGDIITDIARLGFTDIALDVWRRYADWLDSDLLLREAYNFVRTDLYDLEECDLLEDWIKQLVCIEEYYDLDTYEKILSLSYGGVLHKMIHCDYWDEYINEQDEFGDTILFSFIKNYNHIENDTIEKINSVKILLDKGANPNIQCSNQQTPLMIASINDELVIVKLLLKYEADDTLKDNQDRTAYDLSHGKVRKFFDTERRHRREEMGLKVLKRRLNVDNTSILGLHRKHLKDYIDCNICGLPIKQ